MTLRDIVITGVGAVTPLGVGAPTLSERRTAGACAIRDGEAVLALRDRVAPPTIGWEQADEGLDLDYVPGTARPPELADGRAPVALSNSFGFGGHNATLCLEAA